MTNREIAAAFDQVADLLEFQNANPFRVRAYRNGARVLKDYSASLDLVVKTDPAALLDIEGVGKDLAEKITTLVTTGELPQLTELQAAIPAGVLGLLRVPGLGPKRAAILHKELGIQSLDMLKSACEAQQVRGIKGFGAKTEETILAGIALAATADQRMRWAEADGIVQQLLSHFRLCDDVRQIEAAGSYRRGKETIGDLDLLVDATDADAVMKHFALFPGITAVLAHGETKMSVRLDTNLQVDLRVVPTESFGAALQYFTGSKEHNVVLRGRAKDKGLKLNEWGVFRVKNADDEGEYVAGRTEAEVYAALDLPNIPPELREARREYDLAAAGTLPRLIEVGDLRGDLHMHTTATDGTASIREMVAAAQARGLDYIAITDHSQRVSMARGLTPTRLREQWAEIDRLRPEFPGFTLLKGIECDILEAGGMDLPDDVLAEADWVIASLHYGQNQPAARIMERLLGALANPHVDIVAHPTGRLINRREPYAVDVPELIAAAAEHGKLLELNANPMRLDLDDVHCALAKERGVKIVISSDAHSPDGMDVLRYGILQARRAGLTKDDVLNTGPWPFV
jgi:DNA polymerase (family 10)